MKVHGGGRDVMRELVPNDDKWRESTGFRGKHLRAANSS